MNNIDFKEHTIETPVGNEYHGLETTGEISAVVVLRAGGVFEVISINLLPFNVETNHSGLDWSEACHSRLQNWTNTHTIECPDW
jgi:uracil phosphoribosyltransferase